MNRVFLAFALAVSVSACGGSPTAPTSPQPVVPPPPSDTVTQPPMPTPPPATMSYSVAIGPVSPGSLATTILRATPQGVIVGGTVNFASLDAVKLEAVIHEFGHVAGSYHQKGKGVMYPGYLSGVTEHPPEEVQTFVIMFGMPTGTPCPAGSAAIVLQMVCGDNAANINNPGMDLVNHVMENVTMRVDPSIAAKMDVLQPGADRWAGKVAGYNLTLLPGSPSLSMTLFPKNTKTIIIDD